ncbi:MAG: S8 family peptidase [Candidatus Marinimicrobia bacterium]|nr:S8 family peptidase [Candidatus Neomarinimicrobiota bacterium]
METQLPHLIINNFDSTRFTTGKKGGDPPRRPPRDRVAHSEILKQQLEAISRESDDIAEYRRAKETAAFWLDLPNKEQAEWVASVLNRLNIASNPGTAICILDTGVNRGHPLLSPLLSEADCTSFDPLWGAHDHDKHGTLMAGIGAYNNLQELLAHNDDVVLRHCLESVKILPPHAANDPNLWGHITAQSLYKAEIQAPNRKRIACMAVTSADTRDRGRPSSWSGVLDQLCSGADDDNRRFFVVSAGNSAEDSRAVYPEAQETDSVHDPAQSWNALTIGAYTKLNDIRDPTMSGYEPVAPRNGLSPFSTTSNEWEDRWPIKPELVLEGGNLAKDANGFQTVSDDLSLLSTYYDPQRAHFYPFCMTSAATAQAAWMAAQIHVRYPEFWPETVRGLMVHSANWTDTLKAQFCDSENKASYKHLLRTCGYGVPSLEKALFSASNRLTMISQAEIQPFDKKDGGGYRTLDMHLYELPWPKDVLQAMPPHADVKIRVTLSYFIEPSPGEVGWKDRYRYASHGLRFDLNSPTETRDQFKRRINQAARDEENGHPGTNSPSGHWVLGQARDKGSIHSDIWKGSAAELAESNLIAISPLVGWWRERPHKGKWNRKTRYALIISIETPETEVDIYTPVSVQLQAPVSIGISI